ncbi:hypothetical protein [Enterococcus gallinarum]|uniref:hypothetical protein n=1 Tax=Enterococcus gallinarum TaxID=1353 RepID=UPI0012E2CAA9|nr:hypothetical protein [Enterococcus gallinarum]MUN90935.1 hypothetical protein [Enterococcus gallinarum]
MAYSSNKGRKRNEHASRVSHSKIIRNPAIQRLLQSINLPKGLEEIDFSKVSYQAISQREMFDFIIAIDGGYSEVSVKKSFPSSSLSFFQFGAVLLRKEDLVNLKESEFISTEIMKNVRNVEQDNFCLPLNNMIYKDNDDFETSFREALFDLFFNKESGSDHSMIDNLYWLVFKKYKSNFDIREEDRYYNLASCPNPDCENNRIRIEESQMKDNYISSCNECGGKIYLTDIFRLFEIVDNEQGAFGVMGYITNVLEHFMLLSLLRDIYEKQPSLLEKTLFVKDGPLGFFGQTANIHKLFRELLVYFEKEKRNINMVGVEKSGLFVEHALMIEDAVPDHSALFLSNQYINSNIKPTNNLNKQYAPSSYYSGKMIFKAQKGYVYVASIPSKSNSYYDSGSISELIGDVEKILSTLALLKSNSYENSLLPISVINQAVSISQKPGVSILEKFTKQEIQKSNK